MKSKRGDEVLLWPDATAPYVTVELREKWYEGRATEK